MKKGLTEFVFIVDKCSSAGQPNDKTAAGLNCIIGKQKKAAGEAVVTTVMFDRHYDIIHDRTDIKAVMPITRRDIASGNGAALFDALGRTMHKIRSARKHTRPEYRAENVLFMIIADGKDDSSRNYDSKMISERVEHYINRHGWKFIFCGTGSGAAEKAAEIGIPADCVVDCDSVPNGIEGAFEILSEIADRVRGNAEADAPKIVSENTETPEQSDTGISEETMKKIRKEMRRKRSIIPEINDFVRHLFHDPPVEYPDIDLDDK